MQDLNQIWLFFSRWTHQSWGTSWSNCGRPSGRYRSPPQILDWTWWSCVHGNSSSAPASVKQRCKRAGRTTSWSSLSLWWYHKHKHHVLWGEIISLSYQFSPPCAHVFTVASLFHSHLTVIYTHMTNLQHGLICSYSNSILPTAAANFLH